MMNINYFKKTSILFKGSYYMARCKNESNAFGCLSFCLTSISKRRNQTANIKNDNCKVVKIFSSNYGLDEKFVDECLTQNCPKLFKIEPKELESNLNNLHSVYGYPYSSLEYLLKKPEVQLLSFKADHFDNIVSRILSNTMFISSDIKNLLSRSPNVFVDDVVETIDKVNYLYYEMGQVDEQAVANSGVMRFPLKHFHDRHIFLSRRGLFLKIDRHNTQKKVNPDLSSIINSSDEKFCSSIAKCSVNEFEVFKKVLEHENRLEAKLKTNQVKKRDNTTDSSESFPENSLADELLKNI